MLDDNRSNPIPIGFDFWYDGVHYTTLSVDINGLVDFSSSAATGYTAGDYDSDNPGGNNPHTRMTEVGGGYKSRNALAVIYGDLTTQNITDPLGNSFKYLTEGTAPNRILTVEWINLSYYSQYLGESYNFQLKLYENTGVIEYIYGNITAGTGIHLKYKTGLNAPTFTSLNNSVVLIQQFANSTYFLPQPVPAWGGNYGGGYNDTLPTSNSKLVFTPPIPSNPTNLTFTNVTNSSMTLNWIRGVGTNQVGYAIYRSDDGVNYTYVRQVAAGSLLSDEPRSGEPGLLSGTQYWWKVYAVSVGGLSLLPAANSQSTLSATLYTSQGSGTWGAITWSPSPPVPPTPPNNSNIQIRDGDTVRINQDITMNNITVGTGTGGTLLIGDNNNNTVRVLTITGNITVNSGASFAVNMTSNPATNHQLNLTGNLINNNIFNLASDADSRCAITFNQSGNQTISGTGSTTNFYKMTLNMGSSSNNILDVTSTHFSALNGFLTLTNGTFKFSTGDTITPFTASTTIASGPPRQNAPDRL